MSFFRPEALAALRRWAGPAVLGSAAGYALVVGIDLALGGDLLGMGAILLGAVLAFGAIAAGLRGLVGTARVDGGPGVVSVAEGRIGYFGPETGGIVAIDALVSVELVTTDRGPLARDLSWELRDEFGQCLRIPGGAVDSEQLFDALSGLDGIRYQRILDAGLASGNRRFVVWRRPSRRRIDKA